MRHVAVQVPSRSSDVISGWFSTRAIGSSGVGMTQFMWIARRLRLSVPIFGDDTYPMSRSGRTQASRAADFRSFASAHWIFLEIVIAVVGVSLIVVNVVALRQQDERERNKSKVESFASLTSNLGSESPSVRIATTYGLVQVAENYPETRRQVAQILSAQLRQGNHRYYFDDNVKTNAGSRPKGYLLDEGLAAEASLTTVSGMDDWSRTFDISNVYFGGGAMRDLIIERGEAIRTEFHGTDLSQMRWRCVRARGASFKGAFLEDASLREVDLTDADFREAQEVDSVTFQDVWWDSARPPQWGDLEPPPMAGEKPHCLK